MAVIWTNLIGLCGRAVYNLMTEERWLGKAAGSMVAMDESLSINTLPWMETNMNSPITHENILSRNSSAQR